MIATTPHFQTPYIESDDYQHNFSRVGNVGLPHRDVCGRFLEGRQVKKVPFDMCSSWPRIGSILRACETSSLSTRVFGFFSGSKAHSSS